MSLYNIHQAKTHFSKLLQKVEDGEEVIIGKAGKPIAKIVMYNSGTKVRKPGSCKGKIKISEDFDDLPAEVVKGFYNSEL